MKKTVVKTEKFPFAIHHESKVMFLGSCFAENLSALMKAHAFNVEANPFGVLFHPFSITNVILQSLEDTSYNSSIIQREDVFLSWDASSIVYTMSREEMNATLANKYTSLKAQLKDADVLFLTLGTAWGYSLKTSGRHVANCHKFPSDMFDKQLTPVDEMLEAMRKTIDLLLAVNPTLKIVMTVSPVRHVKDGLIENTRSKARLIELVHTLISGYSSVYYFPAYEIVLDELRDYAYFEGDGVHPNSFAVSHIWETFSTYFFSQETLRLAKSFHSLVKLKEHRLIHEESKASKDFKLQLIQKIKDFQQANPKIDCSFFKV